RPGVVGGALELGFRDADGGWLAGVQSGTHGKYRSLGGDFHRGCGLGRDPGVVDRTEAAALGFGAAGCRGLRGFHCRFGSCRRRGLLLGGWCCRTRFPALFQVARGLNLGDGFLACGLGPVVDRAWLWAGGGLFPCSGDSGWLLQLGGVIGVCWLFLLGGAVVCSGFRLNLGGGFLLDVRLWLNRGCRRFGLPAGGLWRWRFFRGRLFLGLGVGLVGGWGLLPG